MSSVIQAIKGRTTIDGGGVRLVRVLGRGNVLAFDPFLMLDSFDSTNPSDYTPGFPLHPHRGIETLTYLIHGQIDHKDSMGNSGSIRDGEAQWMTAGSGIKHQEMPQPVERILGIQLWINLPQKDKMTTPKYFHITAKDIGERDIDGGHLRVVAGDYDGVSGVRGQHLPVSFFDIELEEGKSFTIERRDGENAFIFSILGQVEIADETFDEKTALLLTPGERVTVTAKDGPARFFFFQARRLKEPVAWAGPIVMNTRAELEEAARDLEEGTFVREDAQE